MERCEQIPMLPAIVLFAWSAWLALYGNALLPLWVLLLVVATGVQARVLSERYRR